MLAPTPDQPILDVEAAALLTPHQRLVGIALLLAEGLNRLRQRPEFASGLSASSPLTVPTGEAVIQRPVDAGRTESAPC